MNWRRWVSLVALAGVLLHAAAIVHHNGSALTAAINSINVVVIGGIDGVSVICGPAKKVVADALAAGQNPEHPLKSTRHCPVCGGLAPAHGLPIDAAALPIRQLAALRVFIPGDQHVILPARLRPSGRGPPVLI